MVADWITSITVVGPDGEKRTFPDDFGDITLPRGVTEEDAMNALKLNLGVFGIVVEITLQVQPTESTVIQHFYPQLGELFYGPNPTVKKILQEHWTVQMLYFPYNGLDALGGLIQGLPFVQLWQPKTDEVWVHTVDKVDTYAETSRYSYTKEYHLCIHNNYFAAFPIFLILPLLLSFSLYCIITLQVATA